MICRKEKWKAESQTVYLEIAEFLIHSQKLKEKIKPQFTKDNRNSQKINGHVFVDLNLNQEVFFMRFITNFANLMRRKFC